MQVVQGIIQKHMDEVQQSFIYQSKNDLLDQYIEYKNADDYKAILIHLMLQSSGLPMKQIHTLCIASELVDSGIKTHEKIEAVHQAEITKRQLTVLAGDFYSSKYYKILADHNLIPAIKILAKAIQEINEAKMSRHYANIQDITPSVYIAWLEKIHASILGHLVDEYAIERDIWYEICSNVSLVQALLEEQVQMVPTYNGVLSFKIVLLYQKLNTEEKNEFSNILNNKEKLTAVLVKYNIQAIINHYAEQFSNRAIQCIDQLQTKFVKDEVRKCVNQLFQHTMNHSLAHE
ncbi:hypothetical protein BHU72_03790 [Desulfuribacillus stibiiarsenatis]|uniref:Heptaprenyl diphosphate synthase n=1 Tax=Desulfuribacillus stibiiarsenatis TaxID=1390249 RepID=A0A1E5L6Y1_9FIRM|nr:heptaprenyl diphosphate synthase component 1 [Desulfuribacillus stibiiarsenatis]OEH85905.1 hypothetical protein BHU72_03790 [Desulfuribacillus stibiiarsenatis]